MNQFTFETNDFLGEQHELKYGSYAMMTSRSPVKKTVNEDSCSFFQLSSQVSIAVVCDGVGGNPNGNIASKTIINTLKENCERRKSKKIRNMILDAIEESSQSIRDHKDGSLSTCILAEIHPGWVRFYHVGDSMALLLTQKAELLYYTVSHSPLAFGLELGIKRKDLQHIKNLVNNVVGSIDMRIEMSAKIPINSGDKVILMSDGVSDNYEFAELCPQFSHDEDLKKVLKNIQQRTLSKMLNVQDRKFGGPDDQTALIYQCK